MTLGERIKSLRIEKGLDQKELAEKLNLNSSSISNWETNRRSPDLQTLCTLASFFNVSTDFLLGRTTVKNYELNDCDHLIIKLDKNRFPFGITAEEIEKKMKILLKIQKAFEESEKLK